MKLRVDILKSIDAVEVPDNFVELDTKAQKAMLAELVDGTIINTTDFQLDKNYSAVIADYWEIKD